MSWQATAAIAEMTEGISRSEKLLLLVLANRHNIDTGRCDASVSRIAREALMSARTVYRALENLERKGLIAVEHRTGRTSQYHLICVGELHKTPAKTAPLSRRPPLTFRAPTPDISSETPDIPRQRNHRTEDLEPSSSAAARAREDDATRCVRAYDALMGTLACTPAIVEQIDGWLAKADDKGRAASWFEDACREAAASNGRSLKYVLSILRRWERDGRDGKRREEKRGRASGGRW